MPIEALRAARHLLAGVLLLSCAPPAVAAAGPPFSTLKPGILQVCLYPGFAPFADKQNGVWTGWDVDYLTQFAAAHGLVVEVDEQSTFDGIWMKPGQGRCDIAATGISDTAERRIATRPGACWSSHYYEVVRSFLVRTPDAAGLSRIEDLRGHTVVLTKNSTAHLDVCNRMQAARMTACAKPDADHPCANLGVVAPAADPACVRIDYPRGNDETNAARDVAAGQANKAPFAYGGGYGSIAALTRQTPGLSLVWPHCNMEARDGRLAPAAEPFSFVVARRDTGLLPALNRFIEGKTVPYAGTPNPDLGCPAPRGTQPEAADSGCEP